MFWYYVFMYFDFNRNNFLYMYMDVDSIFGVVFHMWDLKAERQIWLGIRLTRDQFDQHL
jgi:hypothetical protein